MNQKLIDTNRMNQVIHLGRGAKLARLTSLASQASTGWLRLKHPVYRLSDLDALKDTALWVILDFRRRPIKVGVSDKVGTRLVNLQKQLNWTYMVLTTRGDVEARAVKLAHRWKLALPRDREAISAMLRTRGQRNSTLDMSSMPLPPKP